jgi:hypothetical protein
MLMWFEATHGSGTLAISVAANRWTRHRFQTRRSDSAPGFERFLFGATRRRHGVIARVHATIRRRFIDDGF